MAIRTRPKGPSTCSRSTSERAVKLLRKAYRAALLSAYDALQSCANDFDDQGRIKRIGQCITNAVADLDTLALGKGS